MPLTMFDKIWARHIVAEGPGGQTLLYVDRHLLHEGSAAAFARLRRAGRRVRRPDLCVATADHYVLTSPGTPAADGALYEVEGPFKLPKGGVPESWVFGPPAGERSDGGGLLTDEVPGLRVDLAPRVTVGPSGAAVHVRARLDRAATLHLVLRTHDLEKKASGDATYDRPLPVTLAASQQALAAGEHELDLTLGLSALTRLIEVGEATAILTAVAIHGAGTRAVAARRLALTASL